MRRISAIAIFIASLLAASISTQEARADWTGYPGTYPTAAAGCRSIAVFYHSPPIILNFSPVTNSLGQIGWYTCTVVHILGIQNITNDIFPTSCTSPLKVDAGVPSGCSQFTYPPPKQIGAGQPVAANSQSEAPSPSAEGPCGCNQGDNGNATLIANPVSINIGNKFEKVVDYQSVGPQKLSFIRVYNSQARSFSSLGYEWRSNFDRQITFDSGTASTATALHVVRPDGALFAFTKSSGVWKSGDVDIDATLTTDGATSWTFTGHDDTVETYDFTSGRLLSIRTRDGYQQTLSYNSNNLLSTVVDTYGRTLTFTFVNGVLQTLTDPDGRSYTYSYDNLILQTSDRLLSVTYPGTAPNPTVQYLYENTTYPYALTGIIDENGNRFATWTYDANEHAISSQHANGAENYTFSYNYNGIGGAGTVTVTNPLGKQAIYTTSWITGVGKLTKIAQQADTSTPAATSTISYNSNGYVSQRVDNNGNITNYTNDSRGDILSRTEAYGTSAARTTTLTWLSTFRLPTQIVEPGRTTNFNYDSNGFLLSKTETDTTTGSVPYSTNGRTRTWNYTYNATGELATVEDPLNNTTTYAYDATGALTSVTNALSQVTQITLHDASGRPQTVVDPNGVTTTLAYDSRDRLTTVTVNANEVTAIAYDSAGNVTEITKPDGSYLAYAYDNAHRLTTVSNALGETINYTLDAMGGRTLEQIETAGTTIAKTQSRIFDDLGRLLESIGAASQTTAYAYDKDSNFTSITDPLSHVTGRSFDALNRLIKTAAPLSSTINNTYDARDNLTSVSDPRSNVTSYVYDGLNDLIEVSSPDTGTTVYLTDAAGNRTQSTDAAGAVIQYAYDALNRVTSKAFPADAGENATYNYDQPLAVYGVGRLTGVADGSGTTSYAYDPYGNVTQETRLIGGIQYVTAYTYDPANLVTQITYPSGRIVNFARDTMARIVSVATQANALANPVMIASSASYEPFGPLASLAYGNGLALAVQYDQDYRPSTRVVSGTGTAQSLSYGFDTDGNITTIADSVNSSRSQTFQFDALYRLTQATGAYGSFSYGYDTVGNRLSQALTGGSNNFSETYSYPTGSNQLQSIVRGGTTRTIGYDANGNITSDNYGNGTVFGYTYNENHRMVQSTTGGASTSYQVNFLGQRVVKSGATTTHFHYDRRGHLLAESDSAGNVLNEYIWLDDLPVAFITGGTIYFIHTDHLGTPQRLTDANQNVVWDEVSDPFMDGQQITSLLTMNLRMPGQYFDAEDGLHYNFNRDYNPSLGRYIENDPVGLIGGINPYTYIESNPLRMVDLVGLAGVPAPTDPGGNLLPPPVPLPPGKNGQPNKWVPCDPSGTGDRGTKWKPQFPVDSSLGGQPGASWDPEGHWDVDDGQGNRGRYDPQGNPVSHGGSSTQTFSLPSAPPMWIMLPLLLPFPGNPLYAGF